MREKDNKIQIIDMCQEFIKLYGKLITKCENFEEDSEKENENSEKNKSIDATSTINENSEKNEDTKPIINTKIKGSDTKNKTPKTSFISLKMEIDTVLMFKLLIVLMIVSIVMIIVFLLKIEFKPLIDYKIPSDYIYFTIQPPRHNVKNFSIYNKNNNLTTLFDKKELKPIKERIIEEVKPAMGTEETNESETFRDKEFKGECFSSNYEFGI
jgi:hypothetical protein